MIKIRRLLTSCLALGLLVSCSQDYTPKPRGYFRIDFPEKSYRSFDSISFPFAFDYPVYAKITPDPQRLSEKYWINVVAPAFKATIHISYLSLNNDKLSALLEDSHTLLYKQSIKADAIDESRIYSPEKKVYGLLYDVKGNAASPVQFYLTDSLHHFVRGALYFYTVPNQDSLAPVVAFEREDVLKLIHSFHWKK